MCNGAGCTRKRVSWLKKKREFILRVKIKKKSKLPQSISLKLLNFEIGRPPNISWKLKSQIPY